MAIRVEFYGIARQRAATESWTVPLSHDSITLSELWTGLTQRFPRLLFDAAESRTLSPYFAYNVDGTHFVVDGSTKLHAGQTLLIMSADAGG
jgi:molybdopterin converting factor small subunit